MCNYIVSTHSFIYSSLIVLFVRVPLDYADESKGTISLQMARIPATQQPSKGGIFFNPGGPGGSGASFIAGSGAILSKRLGPDWDFISWDPSASTFFCLYVY
jgi:hypothetical protein